MVKLLRVVLLVAIVFSGGRIAFGQGGAGIPECQVEELFQVQLRLATYEAGLPDVDVDVSALDSIELDALLEDAHRRQLQWWDDVVPSLPPCHLAVEIGITGGRVLDEYLIGLVMLESGREGQAQAHLQRARRLQGVLAAQLQEATTAGEVTYRVAFVAEDDVLNVRSGPGVDNPVVGTLAPDAGGITITGEGLPVGLSTWVPVREGNLEGWVNRHFLTQHVRSAVFCNDPRIAGLVASFQQAVANGDSAGLGSLVHPQRGLLLHTSWWNPPVRLSMEEASVFFSDITVRDWGVQDGSGLPITGTNSEVIAPLLAKDLLGGQQMACEQIAAGGTAGLVRLPDGYDALHFMSIYRPAPDADNPFDWGTWVLGFEYLGWQPRLVYLVHFAWEI